MTKIAVGIPVVDMVEVCRARDPGCKSALHSGISFDEAAYVIPIIAIPLAPNIPVWEAANLVQTPTVPRLRYQLHLQDRHSDAAVSMQSCVTLASDHLVEHWLTR